MPYGSLAVRRENQKKGEAMEADNVVENKNVIADEFRVHIGRVRRYEKIMGLAPFIVLLVLIILFSLSADGFLSVSNVFILLNQMSIPLIVATGITFVVLTGGIDLSVDGVMGLSGAMLAILVINDKTNMALGLAGAVIAILITGICGFITGIVYVKGKIPSFMVSFAMSSIAYGFAMLSYGGMPAAINDPLIRSIALIKVMNLPIFFFISLMLFAIALFIQEKTAFGKYIYAIGENEELTKTAGINVDLIKIKVFTWTALFIGVAGICGAAQIGRGDVSVGVGQVFPALAAVVVGGTTLSGGKGGVHRTHIGVLIITILNNGLVLVGANPYIKNGIMGLILIFAVMLTVSRNAKQVVK
jgi:ribose transport system permease protein